MSAIRPRLYIQEVATRDGFQNEARFVETDDKKSPRSPRRVRFRRCAMRKP
jgi:hypothetical protein